MDGRVADGAARAGAADAKTSRYQVIRAVNARRSATEWVRLRPARVAPTAVVTVGLLLAARYPTPRIAVVSAAYGIMLLYQLVEARRAARTGVDVRSIFISHLVFLLLQAAIMVMTGGMRSPLWPGLLGSCLGTLNLFGKSRESTITVAWTGGLVALVALVPSPLAGPLIAAPFHALLAVWAMVYTLLLVRRSAFVITEAYQRTGEELDRMREDVIIAASERAQSLETIGSKVAHELKNPLSAIKGLVQLLGRSAASAGVHVDSRARERLDVITAEIGRMEVILRDYLSFSRPLEDLRPRPVDLGAIADDVVAVLEGRAEVAGVSLRRTGVRARAVGDPRRLKEALLNLASNALEATPRHGAVEVAVTVEPGGASGVEHVRVEIRDTGKGMSPEDMARVGTPFFTKREGGTGLGVVLARAVIAQHGGDVAFASEVGRGTRVTVSLPSRGLPEEGANGAPSSPIEAPAHG